MLANVLDIDEEAMTISLKERYGGLVLFDFRAAFPSTEHDMFRCLEHLRMPRPALNAVPLLVAVTVDPLLRRLDRLSPMRYSGHLQTIKVPFSVTFRVMQTSSC